MPSQSPTYCRLTAFETFAAQLPHIDTDEGLERAAVAVSMHELADVTPEEVAGRLDAIANRIRNKAQGASPRAMLAHLHAELFEEMGFAGNAENYYISENSYLPWVLANRRGIPISLTLVLKCVASRLSIPVDGINAPGHFLAAIREDDGSTMIVDPFQRGQVLTPDEAAALISQLLGRRMAYDPQLLPVATHKRWLLRMLGNLRGVFTNQARSEDARAMQELAQLLL